MTQSVNPRCRHITIDGRRCRLRSLDPATGLCFRHASLARSRAPSPDPQAAMELLAGIDDFSDASNVNQFLGNLVRQLVLKRIARRDAIALAYICQLLLNSLPALDRQLDAQRDAEAGQFLLQTLLKPPAVRFDPADGPPSCACENGLTNQQ